MHSRSSCSSRPTYARFPTWPPGRQSKRVDGTKRALLEWPDLTIRVVSRLAAT